ncbi:unnamed protein product [Rhizoctonia solani]|uniref:Uncharacterized protein n=1 Tax=Rhizoctonia solani TaxID=456999 RepID=A0A8H3H7M8_9AGAM|nr:unnamed protein product [Rhizoctonia solani]
MPQSWTIKYSTPAPSCSHLSPSSVQTLVPMKTAHLSTRAHAHIISSALIAISLGILAILEFGTLPLRNAICRSMYPEHATGTAYTGELAPYVNASSLISYFLAIRDRRTISPSIIPGQILHQSWKSQDVPPVYHSLMTSWRSAYSNWTYVLWDNDDNRALVEAFYPEWLSAYDALPSEIYRADFTRNLYMHTFGGIYADLDSEAISPLGALIKAHRLADPPTAFLGTMKTSSHDLHGIPNAFMASSGPGHPLWLVAAQDAVDWSRARSWDRSAPVPGPEYVSGPVSLRRSIMNYSPSILELLATGASNADSTGEPIAPVVLFSPEVIYPFTWDRPRPNILTATQECVCWMAMSTFNPGVCKRMTGAQRVINYWKHSWQS